MFVEQEAAQRRSRLADSSRVKEQESKTQDLRLADSQYCRPMHSSHRMQMCLWADAGVGEEEVVSVGSRYLVRQTWALWARWLAGSPGWTVEAAGGQ